MTTPHPLHAFMPYGAPELLASARKHMLGAQLASSTLAVLCFALAWLILGVLYASAPPGKATVTIIDVLPRPPAIQPLPMPPPRMPAAPPVRAAHGDPVPVPDLLVEDQPYVGQETVGPPASNDGTVVITEEAPPVIPTGGAIEPPLPRRGDPVDEYPVLINPIKPAYPKLAEDAGVEGKVLVHVLVSKTGRVMSAEIEPKFSIPILDASALETAYKWVFKPAYTGGHPVAAWVVVPVFFKLH